MLRSRHPSPEGLVEAADEVRHQRRRPRHRQADKAPADSLALNLPRLALRDVSVADLFEDLPERGDDPLRVRLADEDRVLAVEVLEVVDFIPPVGGGVRRGALMAVQDQLGLRPHTVVYRHLCLLYSDNGLDGMLMR